MANQIIGLRADGTLPSSAIAQVAAIAGTEVSAGMDERGLRPDGTLPTVAAEHVQRIVEDHSGTGVPIFPTLAEAQAWELANPGRIALWIDAGGDVPPIENPAADYVLMIMDSEPEVFLTLSEYAPPLLDLVGAVTPQISTISPTLGVAEGVWRWAEFVDATSWINFVPPLALVSAPGFTLEMVLQTTDQSGTLAIRRPETGSSVTQWSLRLSSGTLGIYRTGGPTITTTVNIADGRPHHIAFTHDNSVARIWIDGALSGEGTMTGRLNSADNVPLAIGSGTGEPFSGTWESVAGRIRHVAAYSRVLDDVEIVSHAGAAL